MATADDGAGPSRLPEVPAALAGHFNVIAWLPDPAAATVAVERLREAGVSAGDVAVIDPTEGTRESQETLSRTDWQLVESVIRDSLAGTFLGAAIGAVLGVLIVALPPVHDGIGTGLSLRVFGIAAILGVIAGIFGGSMVGGLAGLDLSRAGSNPYDDQFAGSYTLVAAYAATAERQAALRLLLLRDGALEVRIVPA